MGCVIVYDNFNMLIINLINGIIDDNFYMVNVDFLKM